jgi:AcrR family transcriptional regulator
MELYLQIKMNNNLYLRDPEQSELGQRIVAEGINLLNKLGYEDFTFKKLALEVKTTEASIYRYFENKHRLLMYIITWYWHWIEYQLMFHTNNIKDPKVKLEIVIQILTFQLDDKVSGYGHINKQALQQIVITESSKSYLTKNVGNDNKTQLFKPYKDVCAQIASIVLECNPTFEYPRSLASSLVEISHFQVFFKNNLPKLTDFGGVEGNIPVADFLRKMMFSFIEIK